MYVPGLITDIQKKCLEKHLIVPTVTWELAQRLLNTLEFNRKLTGHGPGHPALGILSGTGVLNQMLSRGPFQSQLFHDSVKMQLG